TAIGKFQLRMAQFRRARSAAVKDGSSPPRIRPEFDPGDHLHMNDAGYQAMAGAVDLALFTRKSK
ncbi:MAG: hypothetical protein ABJC09_14505, partial [Terriglobia bacterium]